MIYCYICTTCKTKTTESRYLSEFTNELPCECGGTMVIDIAAQHEGFRNTPGSWPMESDAAGVHPDQARELAAHCEKLGVPTEIKANGNPVFTSREHRKNFCKITNMYDRNAGIGDATPKHNMKKSNPKKKQQRRGALRRALEKTAMLNKEK